MLQIHNFSIQTLFRHYRVLNRTGTLTQKAKSNSGVIEKTKQQGYCLKSNILKAETYAYVGEYFPNNLFQTISLSANPDNKQKQPSVELLNKQTTIAAGNCYSDAISEDLLENSINQADKTHLCASIFDALEKDLNLSRIKQL